MRVYPEYKDSGIEWLGSIPAHWNAISVKRLYARTKRTNHIEKQLLSVYRDYGVIPKSSREDNHNKASDDLTPYQLVCKDDLVMNKMKAWQGSVAVSNHEGIVSPAYYVYQPKDKLYTFASPRYIHYLLRNPIYITQYMSRSKGIRVNQWDLDADEFEKVEVLLPTKDEQTAIFEFLDRETARIDKLIAEKQNFIKLLKEKRQALISHVVTKGLDPHVKMKDSGIEWIGEVPEHWVVVPLKRVLRYLEQGWSPDCHSNPANNGMWGVLKAGAVNGGIYRELENKELPEPLLPRPKIEVKDGDVLMSRASGSKELIGSVAYVDKTRPNLMFSDKLFRLHCIEDMEPKYICTVLGSYPLRRQIELSIGGAEGLANNLSQANIKKLFVPFPPKDEQSNIYSYVAESLSKFGEIISETDNSIIFLKEHRTALISAAVTGKIDVRDQAK